MHDAHRSAMGESGSSAFGPLQSHRRPWHLRSYPFIEHTAAHVDQRVLTATFYAEEALTEDLVPVDVDAVLFWLVWDPTKACIEVRDFRSAVVRSAQTALRDAIGCVELSELSYRCKQLDADVQKLVDDKVAEWGITIFCVEIRNIYVPKEL